MTGKVTFKIASHLVECSIVEKLVKSLKPRDETRTWTAYPDHHQSGLGSSGFLRVSITTYLDGRQPQWIESQKTKIGDLLPEIVGTIMAAGPILDQQKREREEHDGDIVMIDSSCVRVHQHGAAIKKGAQTAPTIVAWDAPGVG